MYKKTLEKLAKNNIQQENVSQEKAIEFLKELIIKKAEENKDLDPEILEKNMKRAFKAGLTALGLIHGTHVMQMKPMQDKYEKTPVSEHVAYRQHRKFGAKYDPKKFDPVAYEKKYPESKIEMDRYAVEKEKNKNPQRALATENKEEKNPF